MLTHYGDIYSDAWAGLYDAETGDALWTKLWPASGYQILRRAAFDDSNTSVVAGRFQGSLDFDGTTATFSRGGYVAKLGAAGAATDVAVVGNALDVIGFQPKPGGGVIAAGYFHEALGTTPIPTPAVGNEDGMIIELDSDLNQVSALVVGSTGYDDVSSVAWGQSLHSYAFGTIRGITPIPGCDDAIPAGDADMLLLKLAP